MRSCGHRAQWAGDSIYWVSEFCVDCRDKKRGKERGGEGRGLGGERGEGEGKRKGTERRVATPLQKVTAKVAAVPQ